MTLPFNPQRLQFYLTVPTPCPYLPDRMERKIFTQLDPLSGQQLNNYLTHAGFRRSQNVIYRPACETCRACQSLRIRVDGFKPHKRFRRIINRNKNVSAITSEALATGEQFRLLKRYLLMRHPHGGMAGMDFLRYEMMVEDGAVNSEIVEYRNDMGDLIACALIDELTDGKSMVYSFFDPDLKAQSLGNYMILNHIERCKSADLSYLYLGYWVAESPKMSYKKDFRPVEILTQRGWKDLDDNQYAIGENKTSTSSRSFAKI